MMSRKKSLSPKSVAMGGAVVMVTAILVGGFTVPASNAWTFAPDSLTNGATVVANDDTNGWNVVPVAIDDASIPSADVRAYSAALRVERMTAPEVGQVSAAATANNYVLGSDRADLTGLQTVARSEFGAIATLGKKYRDNSSNGGPVLAPVSAPIATGSDSAGNITWGTGTAVTELKRNDGSTSFTFPLVDTNQARQSWFTDLEQVSKYSSLTVADVPAATWTQTTSFGYQNVSKVVKQAAAKVSDLVLISEHYWPGHVDGRYLLVDEVNNGKPTTFQLWYSNYPAAYAMYGTTSQSKTCAKSMMVEYAYKALQQEHCGLNSATLQCVAASAAAANYQDFGANSCGSLGYAQ